MLMKGDADRFHGVSDLPDYSVVVFRRLRKGRPGLLELKADVFLLFE
jgi:hypothetical protein